MTLSSLVIGPRMMSSSLCNRIGLTLCGTSVFTGVNKLLAHSTPLGLTIFAAKD